MRGRLLVRIAKAWYIRAKSDAMSNSPSEPTNLVLEQLRLMRAETNARFDKINTRFDNIDEHFDSIEAEIAGLKKEMRGLKLNTIAEVYKANLTVASFADHERRIQALEQKNP
jgi:archaellum component FlaC